MSSRATLAIAAMVGAIGILIGAFGAHALPNLLSDLPEEALQQRLDWLETGSRYHMYHAAALLAIGVTSRNGTPRWRISVLAWLVGIVLFSGCLYAMAITGVRVLGAVVPLGGIAFVIGWVCVAAPIFRKEQTP